MLLDKIGFPPRIFLIPAALGFLCLPLAILCLFPFRAPRFVNMEYQYMKRHGMLDENGDPLPQFELSEEEDSGAVDSTEKSKQASTVLLIPLYTEVDNPHDLGNHRHPF